MPEKDHLKTHVAICRSAEAILLLEDRDGDVPGGRSNGTQVLQLQICSFHRLYAVIEICLTGGKISQIRCGPVTTAKLVNFLLTLNVLRQDGNREIVSQMMAFRPSFRK